MTKQPQRLLSEIERKVHEKETLTSFGETAQLSNDKKIGLLETLPYKRKPFVQRNWGHSFHFLCSYQSKLKPAIAYFLVKIFTEKGETVLDPFSGVGTIPFEACKEGRTGIGIDINPVAFHNTNAKVNPPTLTDALRQVNDLNNYIMNTRMDDVTSVDEFTRRFYHEQTLIEILKAKQYFAERANQNGSLSFIFSCLLHILHGNRPYALSRRSHGLTPLAPSGDFIYKSLIKSLRAKVKRSFKSGIPSDFVRGKAYQASVFQMPIDAQSVDSIITSPPFMSSTRFFANNRIRLWFCGWDYHKQNEMQNQFLESLQVNDPKIYSEVFHEFNRALNVNGLCIMHLGVIKNTNMAEVLAPMAMEKGFKKIGTIYEDTSSMESHGMTDQGVTHKHAFLILQKERNLG